MKNSGGKRSVDAAALRRKLAELEGLRAELQAKYDRLLAEREALKLKSEDKETARDPGAVAASPEGTKRQRPARTIKRKRTAAAGGNGKISVSGGPAKKGS